jgi:hypothetical protein
MLEELQKDVHRILKETDRSIVLSTREILIVSLNCDEDSAAQEAFCTCVLSCEEPFAYLIR